MPLESAVGSPHIMAVTSSMEILFETEWIPVVLR